MGDSRVMPVFVPLHDLEAIGLGDLWHVDQHGIGQQVGFIHHQLGTQIVTELRSSLHEGEVFVYDYERCPYVLELVLH